MRKHTASLVQGIRGTPAPVVKVLPDAPATLIESIPGKAHDTEGIHDRPRAGEFFSGGALKPGESIHRDDLDALAPRVGLGSQPGFEDPLGSARDHVQESAGTATVSYRSQVQNDGDVFVAVGGVAPHMGALRAPVAAHAHMQNRGAPPAGLMRQAPDHRATTNALAPAASTPPVLTSNPARRHCMVWPNALARHLQPQAIQARERAQIRAIKDSIGHVEVFQMDGVGTSIIGRPRPLPGHDTPNPAHNTYTLNYEEPVYPFKFTTVSKQSRLEREWSTTTACLPVRHKTCFIDSISLRSSTGLSPFKVSSRSSHSPHTNQRIKTARIQQGGPGKMPRPP